MSNYSYDEYDEDEQYHSSAINNNDLYSDYYSGNDEFSNDSYNSDDSEKQHDIDLTEKTIKVRDKLSNTLVEYTIQTHPSIQSLIISLVTSGMKNHKQYTILARHNMTMPIYAIERIGNTIKTINIVKQERGNDEESSVEHDESVIRMFMSSGFLHEKLYVDNCFVETTSSQDKIYVKYRTFL